MRDGICLYVKELLGNFDSRRTELSVENGSGRMLDKPLREKVLESFANCVGECISVATSHVS